MSVMKEMLKYTMCANFMDIGWVVFPQLCLLCEEAVAWSGHIINVCMGVSTSVLLLFMHMYYVHPLNLVTTDLTFDL